MKTICDGCGEEFERDWKLPKWKNRMSEMEMISKQCDNCLYKQMMENIYAKSEEKSTTTH